MDRADSNTAQCLAVLTTTFIVGDKTGRPLGSTESAVKPADTAGVEPSVRLCRSNCQIGSEASQSTPKSVGGRSAR